MSQTFGGHAMAAHPKLFSLTDDPNTRRVYPSRRNAWLSQIPHSTGRKSMSIFKPRGQQHPEPAWCPSMKGQAKGPAAWCPPPHRGFVRSFPWNPTLHHHRDTHQKPLNPAWKITHHSPTEEKTPALRIKDPQFGEGLVRVQTPAFCRVQTLHRIQ